MEVESEETISAREGETSTSQQLKKIRRPLSAWMIYCSENRGIIKETNPEYEFKDIARALSEGFKSLTEDERSPFEMKALVDKERYTREMQEFKSLAPTSDKISPNNSLPREIVFPLARIKKTMKFDPNVRNIQKEALVAVSKATELFIAYLSIRSSQVALRNKRRTVKESDVVEVVHTSELLKFLQSDFPKVSQKRREPVADQRGQPSLGEVEDESKKIIEPLNRTINSFFASPK